MRELIDIDDGLPLSSLLTLNAEAGRLSLVAEKRQVNAMTVALTSLFDTKVFEAYNQKTDETLRATDWRATVMAPRRGGNGGAAAPADRQQAVQHTMRELSKLNQLLRMG